MDEKREQNNSEIKFRRQDWELFLELHNDVKVIKTLLEKINLPEMKSTVCFLARFFWILAVGVIGGLITSVFALIVKK